MSNIWVSARRGTHRKPPTGRTTARNIRRKFRCRFSGTGKAGCRHSGVGNPQKNFLEREGDQELRVLFLHYCVAGGHSAGGFGHPQRRFHLFLAYGVNIRIVSRAYLKCVQSHRQLQLAPSTFEPFDESTGDVVFILVVA